MKKNMQTIEDKVQALRAWINKIPGSEPGKAEPVEAYVVPIADPHNSEYIADHWKCLEWLTGFTGSAGTAIVTQKEALLWTDSRYWLQAEEQLAGTPFKLMRDGADGVPSPAEWMVQQGISCDNLVLFAGPYDIISYNLIGEFEAAGAEFAEYYETDFFDEYWADRPALPIEPIDVQSPEFVGASVEEKLSIVKPLILKVIEAMEKEDAEGPYPIISHFEALAINDLSDIAWVLNLRGADIPYNPVFSAYLVYERAADRFILFTHQESMTAAARAQMETAGVCIQNYEDLRTYKENVNVLFSRTASLRMVEDCPFADKATLDIEKLRCVKSEPERKGFRKAMLRDGVALVKFLRWLDESMEAGTSVTELTVDEKFTAFRAEQPGFIEPSFATIAGYAAHGAIVHYEATAESASTLKPKGLLLLDSGAQFDCGTTDITRTLALGPVTDEEKRVYTHVLKGHLSLARLRFPKGSTGLQLDLAARQSMWSEGYDFGHGTGHGVGSHLCVHEGPHQIRKNVRLCTLIPFEAGMTITDEPGIYVEGKFGVRIENMLLCKDWKETAFGHFLEFENLTLCPYDLRPVCMEMLNDEEKTQINAYHAHVKEQLLPLLSDEADKAWLEQATKSI